MITEKLNKIPYYIVISFFVILFSYYLGNILGNKNKKHIKVFERYN